MTIGRNTFPLLFDQCVNLTAMVFDVGLHIVFHDITGHSVGVHCGDVVLATPHPEACAGQGVVWRVPQRWMVHPRTP
ncbi:MAG: hypothetical protein ACE5HA_04285 [Anaerolineae bacterium]